MITKRFEPQWSWKIYREEDDQGEERGMEGGERRRNEMNNGRGVGVTVKLVLTLRSDYRLPDCYMRTSDFLSIRHLGAGVELQLFIL